MTYRNRMLFFLKPFFNHSEIVGIIIKILRKIFQNLIKESIINFINYNEFHNFPDKIYESLIVRIIFLKKFL